MHFTVSWNCCIIVLGFSVRNARKRFVADRSTPCSLTPVGASGKFSEVEWTNVFLNFVTSLAVRINLSRASFNTCITIRDSRVRRCLSIYPDFKRPSFLKDKDETIVAGHL